MVGTVASGKTYFVNDAQYAQKYQIISEECVVTAMKQIGLDINPETLYPIISVMAKSHMIRGLPVVVDEKNLTLESIYSWKQMAHSHGYKVKGIIMDTPKEECMKRLKELLSGKVQEMMIEKLNTEREQVEEIIEISKMKHQNLFDQVIQVPYGG
jgi:predicted kinase